MRWLAAVITVAGLAAAGTAVALAGTGRLDPHGMIVIPALHDAASDQPLRYTPACSRTPIPVCVNPAYAGFLPAVTATVGPELTEFAGLPGAPARLSQVALVYQQEPGNGINVSAHVSGASEFIVPEPLPGQPGGTSTQFAANLAEGLGLQLASHVILGGADQSAGAAPSQAKLAVIAGSVRFPPSVESRDLAPLYGQVLPEPGSPAASPASGSRRCPRPPGTPGWRRTWPRCGPAASRWNSCHDGGRGTPGAPARREPSRSRPPWSCWRCAPPACGARCTGTGTDYGALQLPLIFETACAAIIAVTAGSPFGEPERATGRWLPYLRLGTAITLTGLASGALAAAGTGMPLAGGFPDIVRNVAGLTGIGLLCATLLGGPLAWTGPLAYLVAGVYGLYTDWHPPALSTPWIWQARPPHDVGGALCAAVVFAAGLAAITLRGARERPGGDGPG